MDLPKRKKNRLENYDYSTNGVCFVTICTHNRKKLFCDIVPSENGIVGAIHESPEIRLNTNGVIADNYIKKLAVRFGVMVEKYVIMPNHIHLLIAIRDDERAIHESPLRKRSTLSIVIGYLKMNVSRDIHNNGYAGAVFQRSYHDHVVRNEKDYQEIWEYIENNPRKWALDKYYEG
ncbi:MAG: transposase [Clostridia bacterium]|nr:transposase [Clostridia bacterium]